MADKEVEYWEYELSPKEKEEILKNGLTQQTLLKFDELKKRMRSFFTGNSLNPVEIII
jgi:hypothetical protein